ncbi:aminoglycoside phosphotransferase family protein [Rhodococcus fascians]|nr:aminoglycoside phosphotransferase family protein [Rhodococcus fascians]
MVGGRVQAMACRQFGSTAVVDSVRTLSGGAYNSTYEVHLAGRPSVVLRIAPKPQHQYRSETEMMRNEAATTPRLAPIAHLLPKILGVDWSHDIIDRDFMWQNKIAGIPASRAFAAHGRDAMVPLFAEIGTVTAAVHSVVGPHFGTVRGPHFSTWSDAVTHRLTEIVRDTRDAGLDTRAAEEACASAQQASDALDRVTEPRLLHGDLFIPNLVLDEESLRIVGVLDHDRAFWGDPAADWGIHAMAGRTEAERRAFDDGYGARVGDETVAHIYRALHAGAITLERHRLGRGRQG